MANISNSSAPQQQPFDPQSSIRIHQHHHQQQQQQGVTFVIDSRYNDLKVIGKGAYGVVCSAIDTTTGERVAIKKVMHAFDKLILAKRLLREVKILKHLDHENVIKLYDIQRPYPDDPDEFEDVYLITDLMDTNLNAIVRSSQPLTDEHIQYFLYQVLRGLKYIHSANIMHRDLKPANILINSTCDIKICDLGLARGYDKEDLFGMSNYVVTRWYRAPELLLSASRYSKSVDIWSVGCIFAELIGRAPMFQGNNYLDQIKKIIEILGSPSDEDMRQMALSEATIRQLKLYPATLPIPLASIYPNANPVALDLLSKMLRFSPTDRISSEDALAHPYFDGMHDEEDEPVCEALFDFSFEKEATDPKVIKGLVYDEIMDMCDNESPQSLTMYEMTFTNNQAFMTRLSTQQVEQQQQQQQQQQQLNCSRSEIDTGSGSEYSSEYYSDDEDEELRSEYSTTFSPMQDDGP